MLPAVALGLLAALSVAASPALSVSSAELATVQAAQAAAKKKAPTKFVRTWSYVGPGAELKGARLELRDRTGRLITAEKTTARGTNAFNLSKRKNLKLPLTLTATGGTYAGKAFKGRLVSRIFSVSPDYAIVQNNLVSTAASKLATTRSGYSQAQGMVRKTLGIQKGALPQVLRLRNSFVGYRELMRVSSRAGGFDAFADLVARRAREGKRITGLKPKSAMQSNAPGSRPKSVRKRSNQTSMPPDTSVCTVGVPTSNTNFSSEAVTDIATLGVGSLMQVAGLPETGATESITGMLLSPIGMGGDSVEQQDINAVAADLDCISDQITYLSAQLDYLQLSVDVDTASACTAAINGTNAWPAYEWLVSNSSDTDTPITSSNNSLTGMYLPDWNQVDNTCGGIINQMLFGNTSTQQAGAWQQLAANTTAGLQWINGATNQKLQTFLSSWGMYLYQQFILANEYDNFYGNQNGGTYFTAALMAAGSTTNSAGQAVCGTAATATQPAKPAAEGASTSTYCVWQNNIGAAYPGNLYSDEIGVLSSGASINAIPGGINAGVPINSQSKQWDLADTNPAALQGNTPTAMNLAWWYNYYLNFNGGYNSGKGGSNGLKFYPTGGQPVCTMNVLGNCPPPMTSSNFIGTSVDQFNSLGVNPQGLGSAVQTYTNPQDTSRVAATASDISALKSNGPGGETSLDFLYNAVNQVSFNGSPAWSSLSASDIAYWTADTSSSMTAQDLVAVYFEVEMTTAAPLGSTAGVSGNNKNNYNQQDISTTNPVFAFLMKRTWWPGAASASTYTPPPPPGP